MPMVRKDGAIMEITKECDASERMKRVTGRAVRQRTSKKLKDRRTMTPGKLVMKSPDKEKRRASHPERQHHGVL